MSAKPFSRAAQLALLASACALCACQKSDSSPPEPYTAGAAGVAAPGAGAAGVPSAGSGGAAPSAGSGGDGAAAAVTGTDAMGGAPSAPPDSSECSQLDVASCATNPSCQTLSGQRVTPELCLSPAEAAACGTAVGCVMKLARASDSTGQSWIFPSNCLPAGWLDISASGTRFDPCAAP